MAITLIRERIFRASAIVSIHDSKILVNHLIATQLHFAKSLILSAFLMLSRLMIFKEKIIFGVAENKVKERLLGEPELYLAKTLDLCLSYSRDV